MELNDARAAIGRKMQEHYERVWQAGDAWSLESSEYERHKYDHQLALLNPRRYGKVLEIGCGSGCFTQRLATISDIVVAVDIAAAAIERAKALVITSEACGVVDFRVASIMDFDVLSEGPWDLVVFSETIYCLGWLYPMFDVGYLAAALRQATLPGGRLLLTNTYGQEKDWLLKPWLIDTYRDLFRNVGYQLEQEEIFRGNKDGVAISVLMSLFLVHENCASHVSTLGEPVASR